MPEAAEYVVIVDTNILLELPDLLDLDWGVKPIKVYVLRSVLQELHGLSRGSANWKTRQDAQRAFELLDPLSRRTPEEGFPFSAGRLYFVDAPTGIAHPLNPQSVDHQQIALAQEILRESPGRFCAIVTRDREMSRVARAAVPSIPVVTPSDGNLTQSIQKQLADEVYWFTEFRKEPVVAGKAKAIKTAGRRRRATPDPQSRINRAAAKLYGRIRGSHHRAILAVAPLEMRLAVTGRVVTSLTRTKNRVVFVFVVDDESARWWAAEIYRRSRPPAGSVLVFGDDPIRQVGQVRVVVYRHDQIVRRLDQHIARFTKAGRKITPVVDGCDTMDPVGIAVLLSDFDQFVGFARLPAAHAQARARRLLDAFFRRQTIADYTFLDAECDGWVPPFEILRHEVTLDQTEAENYATVNDEFLALHGEISLVHPELPEQAFWQELYHMLDGIVDPVAAQLFMLREQREAIAQSARAKIDTVAQLVTEAGVPARCLVFDYGGVRTGLLVQRLQGDGVTVGVVERFADRDAWEAAWRPFEQGRTHCLIAQDVPPPGVVGALVNRLIVVTPLLPMTALAAMMDWVLAHATNHSTICIDLLYTKGTPEREAMRDFAESWCGLRFTC